MLAPPAQVLTGSPADQTGFKRGDELLAVGDKYEPQIAKCKEMDAKRHSSNTRVGRGNQRSSHA